MYSHECRALKILQVVPYFPPAYAFGGPVNVAYQMSNELTKNGHKVVVYTSNVKDINYRLCIKQVRIIDGIEVHYMKYLNLIPIKKLKLFITTELSSKIKNKIQEFNIIHLHEYRTYQNIIIHHYARKYGVPYVLQAHGSLPRMYGNQQLKWIYDVFFGYSLLRDASIVIALNKREANQYMSMGVPEEKIEIIPNGINLSEYCDISPKGSFRKKYDINENDKMVLYLGRIHESKGLDLLAKSFNIISKELKSVKLVVAGPDDGYLATFSNLISDLRLEKNVLLTGFLSKRDKLAALVDSDIFVTPKFYGFPITFLEACLAGCPIVTTSNELSWIHENVGYVTESSPRALADKIALILTNENIRQEMSMHARHLVENEFTIEKIVHKLENLYKGVLPL